MTTAQKKSKEANRRGAELETIVSAVISWISMRFGLIHRIDYESQGFHYNIPRPDGTTKERTFYPDFMIAFKVDGEEIVIPLEVTTSKKPFYKITKIERASTESPGTYFRLLSISEPGLMRNPSFAISAILDSILLRRATPKHELPESVPDIPDSISVKLLELLEKCRPFYKEIERFVQFFLALGGDVRLHTAWSLYFGL